MHGTSFGPSRFKELIPRENGFRRHFRAPVFSDISSISLRTLRKYLSNQFLDLDEPIIMDVHRTRVFRDTENTAFQLNEIPQSNVLDTKNVYFEPRISGCSEVRPHTNRQIAAQLQERRLVSTDAILPQRYGCWSRCYVDRVFPGTRAFVRVLLLQRDLDQDPALLWAFKASQPHPG